jgi:AAA domain
MPDDPIWGGRSAFLFQDPTRHLSGTASERSQFELRPVAMPDPASIPPRAWIYGTQLIRRYVTLLIAGGATGKSSYVIAVCASVASGRSLLGGRVHQRCNAALLNLEDAQDEQDRRLAALAMHHDVSAAELRDRFFVNDPERGLTIATVASDGFTIIHPDEEAVIEQITRHEIGVLAVDPFAECHTLEENSNPQMIQAVASWRRVARATNCAVLVTHHVRKGVAADIEAARGAKALTDSARVGLLLSTMTTEEASSLNVPLEERLRYVRLDDAKMNLAARSPKPTWFHLEQVELRNGTPAYPNGDRVAVLEAWEPQTVWARFSFDELNKVLDSIASGMPGGGLYSPDRRSPDRWAGLVLIETLGLTDDQAAQMIKTWIANGVLAKKDYQDAQQRKSRVGLRVVDARRPGTNV